MRINRKQSRVRGCRQRQPHSSVCLSTAKANQCGLHSIAHTECQLVSCQWPFVSSSCQVQLSYLERDM